MKSKPTMGKARNMSNIIFVIPSNGDQVAAPEIDWLRWLVFRRGTDFWSSGSGQGWLKHTNGDELLIAFVARKGFYLQYIDPHPRYWIPFDEDLPGGKVPVWIGGDPIIVSRQFFVGRDQAWAAVEEFCASGKRTNQINWVRESDVDWDYDYWDHPDVKLS